MLGGPALLTLLTLLGMATWEESSPYSEWGASNGVGRDIGAIHSLALLTSSEGSFLEDFASLLALEMQGMFQGTILERKAESEYMPFKHAFLPGAKPKPGGRMSLILVSARLRTAAPFIALAFPLALPLATINLRYAGPPLILLGFINGRLHPCSAAPNLCSPSVAPGTGWLLLATLAVSKFSCLS